MIFCIRALSTYGYNSNKSSKGMLDCRKRNPLCIPYVFVYSDWAFWFIFWLLFLLQYQFYNGSSSAARSALLFIMPSVGLVFIALFLPFNPVLATKEESCRCCFEVNTMAQLASTSQAIVQAFHMGFVSDDNSKPPVVFLADGGHYENSGLLYLMEKVALLSLRVHYVLPSFCTQLHYGDLKDYKYIIFMNGRKHFVSKCHLKIGSKAQTQVKKMNECKDFFFWKRLKPHVGTLVQPS